MMTFRRALNHIPSKSVRPLLFPPAGLYAMVPKGTSMAHQLWALASRVARGSTWRGSTVRQGHLIPSSLCGAAFSNPLRPRNSAMSSSSSSSSSSGGSPWSSSAPPASPPSPPSGEACDAASPRGGAAGAVNLSGPFFDVRVYSVEEAMEKLHLQRPAVPLGFVWAHEEKPDPSIDGPRSGRWG
ncbi:hypothetical protein Naga_100022g29 [Nannochloropsis gaditana]|uniref:Uncharacterized protein n=1 Tax=Nannochloropsis gaditana TaxID=72520 RepID=W7UAF5_9STRA|nr:hypothetical protein Naga_100022g29 [Nannochloropsis gaditana]